MPTGFRYPKATRRHLGFILSRRRGLIRLKSLYRTDSFRSILPMEVKYAYLLVITRCIPLVTCEFSFPSPLNELTTGCIRLPSQKARQNEGSGRWNIPAVSGSDLCVTKGFLHDRVGFSLGFIMKSGSLPQLFRRCWVRRETDPSTFAAAVVIESS